MQWGQIKTLFIICFLVLNVFLVYQLVDKGEEDITFIPETSREDELAFNIGGLDELSDKVYTAPLLYARNYNYNQEENEILESLTNQQTIIINDAYLYSRFDEPVSLDGRSLAAYSDYIYDASGYSYWGEIESVQVLVYFQKIVHPIFFNQNTVMYIQLNEEGQMTQYVQTRLDQLTEPEEERSLINQYDAVYRLYHNSNVLRTGDAITDVHLGYHNLVSLPNGEQLLNPAWAIEVNQDDYHFVNAIEGHNYPQNTSFYESSIAHLVGLIEDEEINNFEFYHLNDSKSNLVSTIRKSLVGVYQNIVEVDLE